MTPETKNHEQEIQDILKTYPLTYTLAVAFVFIVISILIGNSLFGKGGLLAEGDNGYAANVYTDVISVLVTVFVIDRLNRRRDEQRDLRQLQEQLVRDASSMSNEVAKNAVHQLRKREWLEGENSLLKGADLRGANLQDADLVAANLQAANLILAKLLDANLARANLQGTKLMFANLQGAFLDNVNLQSTDLASANLQDVISLGANLQRADLNAADLHGATLDGADLQGTNLSDTNLQGVYLDGAKLTESTTLPDATNWTSATDMTRFTNPNHPNFWRSDNPSSPAYRGDTPTAPALPK